jgi:predicted ATP-grasp superfamily ATP-dependent carboligase
MNPGIVIGGDYQGLGIIRNLAREGIKVYLIETECSIGRCSKYVEDAFKYTGKGADFLINLAKKNKNLWNGIIFPTDDIWVKILSQNKKKLEKYFIIPTPEWEKVKWFYDKELTYKLAKKLNIPIPKTYPEEEIKKIPLSSFPLLIKPTSHEGFYYLTKKKAIPVKHPTSLSTKYSWVKKVSPETKFVFQEIIKGGLFSYCTFFKNSSPIASLVGERVRQHPMDFGRASTFVKVVKNKIIEKLGIKILKEINYYGLAEVEFMYDKKEKDYKLLEVNPRTWGWHTIGNGVGINFVHLLYKDLTKGRNIDINYVDKKIKWIRMITDVGVGVEEILKGRMSIVSYLKSIKGEKEFAVWDKRDKLPFFKEIFLLPYLYKIRGW